MMSHHQDIELFTTEANIVKITEEKEDIAEES